MPVHEELRRNAAARIGAGLPLVEGVLGFDDTVLPQLENALLAGHDIILLGERGQAKTRIVRSLTSLLDEWVRPSPVNVPKRESARTIGQRSVAQNGQYSAPR